MLTMIMQKATALKFFAQDKLSPILDLAIRIYMSLIFLKGGWLKFETYLNQGWKEFIVPFQDYHPIPGVPAGLVAPFATAAELILPTLLILGLFSRVSAFGLFMMTVVIQYVVPAEYGVQNAEHYYWMFLLLHLSFNGGNKLSADHFLFNK